MITRIIDCIIERRLLVSYRIDPELVDALLPPPFRPQLVNGNAVGGVCFIRMRALRPAPLPRARTLILLAAAIRATARRTEPPDRTEVTAQISGTTGIMAQATQAGTPLAVVPRSSGSCLAACVRQTLHRSFAQPPRLVRRLSLRLTRHR